MSKHPKHLFVNSPAFAANLSQLQSPATHPYQRQQAAELVYASCYPYVEQQTDLYAGKAAELGIERADLAQGAALKLWEYVSSINSTAPLSPKAVVLNVYNLVRDEILETCKAGSGTVQITTSAEHSLRAEERKVGALKAAFIHESQREVLLERAQRDAALAKRYVGYEAAAKLPALRLDEVHAAFDARVMPVDEDAMMDGVFDTPTQGAAELMRAPQLPLEDEIDIRRQRNMVIDYARERLPARHFEILSKRYGLESGKNEGMTAQQIAEQEGVSRGRIQQIEENAIARIRHHLGNNHYNTQAMLGVLLRNE